jgi:hypothetical protein
VSSQISKMIRQEEEAAKKLESAENFYNGFHSDCSNADNLCISDSRMPEYVQAFDSLREASQHYSELVRRREEMESLAAREFGIFMWWDPNDEKITFDNAACVIGPAPVVQIVEPPQKERNTSNPFIDKNNWLTLRIDMTAPLEGIEALVRAVVRPNRIRTAKRHRVDKDRFALEVYDLYQHTPNFNKLALKFRKNASTIRGMYVRGYALINEEHLIGTSKSRRAQMDGSIKDPAGEFEAHYASCQRCPSATTSDQMCHKWRNFVSQD